MDGVPQPCLSTVGAEAMRLRILIDLSAVPD
jgi:hypothetical protein